MNTQTKNITIAGLCLALAMVLPFLTGQIPQIGSALSPMHIPVLLCGFLAGGFWGLLVGAAAPLLRFALFGMPPLMPMGIAMAFELATYGLIAGLVYRMLPGKPIHVYIALVIAMLAGRVVFGTAMYLLMKSAGNVYTMQMFLSAAFIKAVPGIILHLLLIPPIVLALKKSGFLGKGKR